MRSRLGRAALGGLLAAALTVSLGVTAVAQTTTVSTDGIGKAPAGSGIGTKAALENPNCNADAVEGYGVFPYVTMTGGPYCVAPAPKDNGGATARGVTKDKIKVAVLIANQQQVAAQAANAGTAALPTSLATGQVTTMQDALLDAWAPVAQFYEQWGREVDWVWITSTGDDEAAQRADAVKVDEAKPFFVIDSTPNGETALQTALAAKKYVVYGYGSSVEDVTSQAPYRWGQTDQQAGALNAAEFAGKQLAKGKAEYAGSDDLRSKPRAFGMVYSQAIDIDAFQKTFAKYGGKLATPGLSYQASPGILGDPATAQEQAPTMIAKLKSAGVTSIFLCVDSALVKAMTNQATAQDYHPEWITCAYQYNDLSLISRGYDQEQWSHAFGVSNLFPLPGTTSTATALDWYWGANQATSSSLAAGFIGWLGSAIQYAGPTLTAANVQKGFFSIPARGGAASDSPVSFMQGYGKTPGLPYDEYMQLGVDFAPIWYDSQTTGESQVRAVVAKGVTWYPDEGQRYRAGTWPTKKISLFDPAGAAYYFQTSPVPAPVPAPCTGCPSQGGSGTPSHYTA